MHFHLVKNGGVDAGDLPFNKKESAFHDKELRARLIALESLVLLKTCSGIRQGDSLHSFEIYPTIRIP